MTTFYIGTYTSGSSRGIYRANLDSGTGLVDDLQLAAELDNPTFLSLHPNLPILYACSEIRRNGKREGAKLVAYRVQPNGDLTWISEQPTGGQGPCYVSVDELGSMALVAHYASGSVVSLPIHADGTLAPVSQLNQHAGKGPHAERQEGPHAHCIVPAPGNGFACAVDLGVDQVLIYGLEDLDNKISPTPVNVYHAPAGSGPRHLTFEPGGDFAFLIHELSNTVSVLSWDAERGRLEELDSISTLPDGFTGESTAAEIIATNDMRIFASNRGSDSLVELAFDEGSEKLNVVQHIASGGKTPRNFRLNESERFLLAANQDSDSIVVFKLFGGPMSATGATLSVGNPSCIKFRY